MFRKIELKHKVYIACFAWTVAMIFNNHDMYATFACGIMFTE